MKMFKTMVLVIVCLVNAAIGLPLQPRTISRNLYPFHFVSREAWGARAPNTTTNLKTPVPFVVIHHTYIPVVCTTKVQCEADMRSMQQTHMDTNNWADIGYNFAVGGEGSVYEGRGWQTVGAHAVGYNSQSIGIVLIGDFVSQAPVEKQLQAAKDLITYGVSQGFISKDYELIGHRQATATLCPGDALYREIQTWDRFSPI